MAALPYMQLYPADYLADTMHLNAEKHGAYLLLIMNYWQTGKPLPNDDERLATIARVSNERWTDVKRTLMEFFVLDGDALVHPRIESDLKYVEDKQHKAAQAGKASAIARAKKRTDKENAKTKSTNAVTDVQTDVATDGEQTYQHGGNHKDPDPDKDKDKEDSATFLQAKKIARYLAGRILKENKKVKVKPDNWIADIERCIRLDRRSEKELVAAINWIYAGGKGSFWIPNVLSGKKLRDNFDQLTLQMSSEVKVETKKAAALPRMDDELVSWAAKNGYPQPRPAQTFPEYRRLLENELEKRGDR